MDEYVKKVAAALAPLDYKARTKLLAEVMQNMNERAEQGGMDEVAAFLVAQLGGDAEEVVKAHAPAKKYVGPDISDGRWN
jgi:hypothetical protein